MPFINKLKNVKAKDMTISEPFLEYGSDVVCVRIEIDLTQLVDGHDYHDFPSSVNLWYHIDDLRYLISALKLTLLEATELKRNIKRR